MRSPTTLKIKFKSVSIEDFIERYSVDVSGGGIFIRTKKPLDVGTPLKFEFQLQDGTTIMNGDGTVAWARSEEVARPNAAPGMGVRFDRVAGSSLLVLDRILHDKERRGERAEESRFEAGLRDAQSAAGTIESPPAERDTRTPAPNAMPGPDRDSRTPLPSPMPGLSSSFAPSHADDFDSDESTRVMQPAQAEALLAKSRELAPAAAHPVATASATARTMFEMPAPVLPSASLPPPPPPPPPTTPPDPALYPDPFADLAEEMAREAAAEAAASGGPGGRSARSVDPSPVAEPAAAIAEVAPVAEYAAPAAETLTVQADLAAPPSDSPAPPTDVLAAHLEAVTSPDETYAPPLEAAAAPAYTPAPPVEAVASSAEMYAPPVEATAAPADAPAPPVEAAVVPADAPAPPVEAVASPAETYAPPAGAAAAPADAPAPPVEAVASLAETHAPPVEAAAAPADAHAPPVEAAADPADAHAPPVEAAADPADASAPPLEAAADPADLFTPPAEAIAPPDEALAPTTEPVALPPEAIARYDAIVAAADAIALDVTAPPEAAEVATAGADETTGVFHFAPAPVVDGVPLKAESVASGEATTVDGLARIVEIAPEAVAGGVADLGVEPPFVDELTAVGGTHAAAVTAAAATGEVDASAPEEEQATLLGAAIPEAAVEAEAAVVVSAPAVPAMVEVGADAVDDVLAAFAAGAAGAPFDVVAVAEAQGGDDGQSSDAPAPTAEASATGAEAESAATEEAVAEEAITEEVITEEAIAEEVAADGAASDGASAAHTEPAEAREAPMAWLSTATAAEVQPEPQVMDLAAAGGAPEPAYFEPVVPAAVPVAAPPQIRTSASNDATVMSTGDLAIAAQAAAGGAASEIGSASTVIKTDGAAVAASLSSDATALLSSTQAPSSDATALLSPSTAAVAQAVVGIAPTPARATSWEAAPPARNEVTQQVGRETQQVSKQTQQVSKQSTQEVRKEPAKKAPAPAAPVTAGGFPWLTAALLLLVLAAGAWFLAPVLFQPGPAAAATSESGSPSVH